MKSNHESENNTRIPTIEEHRMKDEQGPQYINKANVLCSDKYNNKKDAECCIRNKFQNMYGPDNDSLQIIVNN